MRLGIALAAVFAAGLAAGWISSGAQQLPALVETSKEDPLEVAKLRENLQRAEEDRAALEKQNADLRAEADLLREEQDLLAAMLDEMSLQSDASEPTPPSAATPPTQEPRRDRRGQPTPEQMEAFRRDFEERQEAMRARIEEALAATGDPKAIPNFDTLMAYRDQQDDLRRAMRDAQTDAEREDIVEDLRAIERASRDLVTAQQDSMLRSLAAKSGISDAAAQQRFVEAARAALGNPFFAMEPMLTGGGRRGPGWGRP